MRSCRLFAEIRYHRPDVLEEIELSALNVGVTSCDAGVTMRDESVRQKERAREKQEGAQHDYSVHRENLSCAALQTRQAISQAEPAMQALT